MRERLGFLMALVLIVSLSGDVEGHLPADVMYFAVQFPDTYLPTLDGDLSEWDVVPSAYMIYTEDMYEQLAGLGKDGVGVDLADLAIRSCCGWNDSMNRLYFMAEVSDDIHQTDRTDPRCNWTDDCWEIVIDANHNGGRHAWFGDLVEPPKEWRHAEGTLYIIAEPPVQGVDFTSGNLGAWVSERGEFFDAGWDFAGDEFGESTYCYELFIYPFDNLDYRGPDASKHHDLTAGEILGIGLAFADFDALSDDYDAYWTVSGGDATCGLSEALADFRLQPVEPRLFRPLAVEEITWGRIKTERAR